MLSTEGSHWEAPRGSLS